MRRGYQPYAINWAFLPDEALTLKDNVRRRLTNISNVAANSRSLSPLWCLTLGSRTIKAVEKAGVLFVHIPKTAGTSISACLYRRNLPHYTALFYRNVFGGRVARLPSFSIIRHPMERLMSSFKMAVDGGTDIMSYDRADRSQLQGLESFSAYVDFVHSNRNRLSFLPIALHEQASFIQDSSGRILVDRLFPLGNGRGLPAELASWLGIRHIPHLNATPQREEGISTEVWGKVSEVYARDFGIFNSLQSGGWSEGAAHPS